MKLAKSEIEKIALGGVACIVLLWAYLTLMLWPLHDREKKSLLAIAEVQPKIDGADAQLAKTKSLELKAQLAQKTLDQIKALIPEGAPVAWFPPRVQEFFKRQGIERASTRLSNEFAEKEMPGFRKIFWSIDLPKVGILSLGRAIAQLENEEPLLEITNLQIEAVKDNPEFAHAILTVATIAKQ